MEPDIIELPERNETYKYILDPDIAYLLKVLSYLSCTIYEVEKCTNE